MLKKELDLGYDECNISSNESFENVLADRLSRRDVMKIGACFIGASLFGSFGAQLSADDSSTSTSVPAAAVLLGFNAVPKSLADTVSVPAGYTSKVIFATGDPIKMGVSTYKNNGTDSRDFENRSGDYHDGMIYFGLKNDNSGYDATNSKNGLLCMNHEYINQNYIHTTAEVAAIDKTARVTAQVDKEIALHGVTIVKVTDSGSGFGIDKSSSYNRRITGDTPIALNGPARGNVLLQTAYSTNGTMTRGTLNNCAVGSTPWGTFLTCEENWSGYFKGDTRTGKEAIAMSRYGIKSTSHFGWESVYPQFSASITGADATADYRNVANTQGYVVEIDPFSPTSTSIKRTSMGRFAHETASLGKLTVGKPVVFYMGDDAKGEYIYKFVSNQNWDAADVNGGLSAGDKYLDAGTLYAAKFNADGTGQWLKLDITEPAIATYTTYPFVDAADVAVHTRIAADAVGATKMDRPEWCDVHPTTGEVYMTLTNNSDRGKSGKYGPDAANPRYYTDTCETTATNKGNVNGHIIRWKETGEEGTATTFMWDIYLFGAQSDANGTNVNISGLTDDNDFSCPDGLCFSEATKGLMWIQTDDGAYTDVTNCMMLAAVPGNVGDGAGYSVANTAVPTNGNADQTIATFVGKDATASTLKRFLVGPKNCELTGIAETPDGKTIFVNIQHPGEEGTASTLTSNWPDGGTSRPRSATVVITKNDGGVVGY